MGNYTELFYHLVWATKRRQPFITPEVEQPLFDFIRHKCKALGGTVHAVNGMPDHVHLACTLPAAFALSDFVRKIKGSSAYFINEQAQQENNLRMCLYWQSGFGVLTLEEQILPRVVRYVDNQKRRHAAKRLSTKLEQCDDGHSQLSSPEGTSFRLARPFSAGKTHTMLTQTTGEVIEVASVDDAVQQLIVRTALDTRRAWNYVTLTGRVYEDDEVLLNTTAQTLHLGTGGYDYVIANLSRPSAPPESGAGAASTGHIIKGRYLPCQQAVLTLEEQSQYADVWARELGGFPVLVGQLHSQIAPAAAALHLSGKAGIAYVMTDQAALPMAFSKSVRELKAAGLLTVTITCGQAFGGDYETVTLHSALLAARHILDCDAAIVCQGPGNAGTGTKYGFSGIEQAQNLDIVKALGGTAIAIARMSSADARERHHGISHHTRTTLEMAYARCIVPLPAGTDDSALPPGHDVRFVEGAQAALDLLAAKNILVTTMGRTPAEDPAFFLAAAAAGMVTV